MKKRKRSNLSVKKYIVIAAVIALFSLLLAFFIKVIASALSRVVSERTLRIFLELCHENGVLETFLTILLVMSAFLFLIAFINQILPMLGFFFGKPLTYFSLWRICRKNGYSFRLHRVPFASLGGVSEKSDIEIKMGEKTIHVHFIDIPFPFLRMLLLVNDREYRMHRAVPGKLRSTAGFIVHPGEHEMDHHNYTIYTMPELISSETEKHYLVISPSYAYAFFIENRKMLPITGECESGNVTACRVKILKKRLKNESSTPMEQIKKK